MNHPNVFENPCPICKREVATRLCDYVTEYVFTTSDFIPTHLTCDLPLCEDCATKYGPFDFCPHHEALHQQSELPRELRKYAIKEKVKMIRGDNT